MLCTINLKWKKQQSFWYVICGENYELHASAFFAKQIHIKEKKFILIWTEIKILSRIQNGKICKHSVNRMQPKTILSGYKKKPNLWSKGHIRSVTYFVTLTLRTSPFPHKFKLSLYASPKKSVKMIEIPRTFSLARFQL